MEAVAPSSRDRSFGLQESETPTHPVLAIGPAPTSDRFQTPVTPDFLTLCLDAIDLPRSAVSLDLTGRRNLVIIHQPSRSVFRFPRAPQDAETLADSAQRHLAAVEAGLPVPPLITYRPGTAGSAYLQARLLTGDGIDQPAFHNLAVRQPVRVGRQLAGLLRALRQVSVDAWPGGSMDLPELWDAVGSRLAAVEHQLPADVFESFSGAVALARAASLDQVPGLVHGDLGGINTRFDHRGRLTGILDWDGAVHGDVAADVAAVAVALPIDATDAMIRAHTDLADDIRRCDTYVATWAGQGALWSIEEGDHAGLERMIQLDRQER